MAWKIVFTVHGEVAREWTGYANPAEARAALRDADQCIPFHWDHEVVEDRPAMTPTAAGYIIQDKQGNAIYGVGETVDEAWAEVCAEAGPFFDAHGNEKDDETAFTEDFRVYGATADLIQRVKDHGGAITWEIVDGVACTPSWEGEE